MPIDFKASQIKTQKIIASGSLGMPYLMLYPSGSSTDDQGGFNNISGTGSDGWLFLSGGINSNEKVVFGGDSTVSGTFIVDPQATDSLISANVNSNPTLSRVGIKKNIPESTFHIGGTSDPALLVDSGAVINYGRNNSSSATFLVQGKLGGDHGLLVVSGCCDRVSIGKHNPNSKLDVYGDVIFSGSLNVTSSLVARSITGSIQYVDESMTTPFLAGGASYDPATGQWFIDGGSSGGIILTPRWKGSTTDGIKSEIFLDGISKKYRIPNNSAQSFIALAAARQTGGSAGSIGDSHWFRIEGAVKNVSGSVSIVGASTTYDDGDAATSTWDMSLEADDSNNSLIVKVTGETDKNIDWSVTCFPVDSSGAFVSLDGQFNWYGSTTDSTATEVFLDGLSKRLPVKSGENHTFSIIGKGIQTNSGGGGSVGDCRWFKIDGSIKNVAGTTSIVGSTTTFDDGDASTSAWDISILADDTNDSLKVTVQGENSKDIDWIVTGYVTDTDFHNAYVPGDTVTWEGYTTGSDAIEIFSGGLSKRFLIPQDTSKVFQIIGLGRQIGGSSGNIGDSHWFMINGAIKNVAGTTSIVGSNYAYDDGDPGTPWNIDVFSDDINDAMLIAVTGSSDRNIAWNVKGYISDIYNSVSVGSFRPSGYGSMVQFNDGGAFGSDGLFTWNKYTSTLTSQNITGSLTRLADGTSYLIAGSNITISTGSSGAVTISSAGGSAGYFNSTTPGSIYTTGSTAFIGNESIDSPKDKGSDVFFYVSGSKDGDATSLFSGNVVVSGSVDCKFNSTFGTSQADLFTVNASLNSNIIPMFDSFFTLGSPSNRFAHVYTGDLHLRNDRGDWTIVEERDYLCVVNNITGKKYKMSLIPIEEG